MTIAPTVVLDRGAVWGESRAKLARSASCRLFVFFATAHFPRNGKRNPRQLHSVDALISISVIATTISGMVIYFTARVQVARRK